MPYKEQYENLIGKLLELTIRYYADRLITVAVFGSVARGAFSPDSDIDILIVAESLPYGRIKRIEEFRENIEKKLMDDLKELTNKGIYPFLSPIFKTPDSVILGSPLFLDMTDTLKILYDKGDFFKSYLDSLKKKLDALGAKRIFFKGGYYWNLKPDYKYGDVIEL